MVQIVHRRPLNRAIAEGDTINVLFTATSILDGQLTLWGQLPDIDDPNAEFKEIIDDKLQTISEDIAEETDESVSFADNSACLVRYSCDNRKVSYKNPCIKVIL